MCSEGLLVGHIIFVPLIAQDGLESLQLAGLNIEKALMIKNLLQQHPDMHRLESLWLGESKEIKY